MFKISLILTFILFNWFKSEPLLAHGSVTPEDDICIIRIGYYKAHFKMYLPHITGHNQHCEDIPTTGETVFIMEYEHSGLGEVPIDFRIINNVTGQGNFTKLDDILKINDLDSITILHHKAAIQSDVFTLNHTFVKPGKFVGIVTAPNPESKIVYTAVFPFTVGFTGIPWLIWFSSIAILIQINYLWMNGTLSKWHKNRKKKKFIIIDGKKNNA